METVACPSTIAWAPPTGIVPVRTVLLRAAVVAADSVARFPEMLEIVVLGAIPVPETTMPTVSPTAEETVTTFAPMAAVPVTEAAT